MVISFEQVCQAREISVQLMAIRTLVRFARRFKEQNLSQFEDKFQLVL